MSNFDKAFEEVLLIEKGYANSKYDKGGETKYGIAKRFYPNLDIKNLTIDQAKEIYRKDYWDIKFLGLDKINQYDIQVELFDTGVNMGVKTSAKMFQEALNLLNRNERKFKDLKVDGWIGQESISAYNKLDWKVVLKVLNGLQFMRYVEIVEHDKEQEMNFVGWMKRVKF